MNRKVKRCPSLAKQTFALLFRNPRTWDAIHTQCEHTTRRLHHKGETQEALMYNILPPPPPPRSVNLYFLVLIASGYSAEPPPPPHPNVQHDRCRICRTALANAAKTSNSDFKSCFAPMALSLFMKSFIAIFNRQQCKISCSIVKKGAGLNYCKLYWRLLHTCPGVKKTYAAFVR